uniref:Uncharacterized protein n=1 Tax=Solanum lycopersicum TaxID=4081 RepID=A0A3Q7EB01_SOLLC
MGKQQMYLMNSYYNYLLHGGDTRTTWKSMWNTITPKGGCKNLDFIKKWSSLIRVDQLCSSEVERYCVNFILLHDPKRYECLVLKRDVISSPLLRDLQSSNTSYSHGVLELEGDI